MSRVFCFLPLLIIIILIIRIIGASVAGDNNVSQLLPCIPANLNICELTVVPILAPIIIGIELRSPSIPELTKLTTITVVAAELCVATVIIKPTNKPLKVLSTTLFNYLCFIYSMENKYKNFSEYFGNLYSFIDDYIEENVNTISLDKDWTWIYIYSTKFIKNFS